MKKLVGVWLVLLVLFACSSVSAIAEASITILSEDEEMGEEISQEEDTLDADTNVVDVGQEVQEASQDAGATGVRWTYPVPIWALRSSYNELVNREHLLDESFEPSDLMKMTVKRATSAAVYMERTAGQALEKMFEAASEEGYKLFLKSGYRSYGTQKTTYVNRLESNGGKDDGVVAYPGSSEHQTGLSCDILNEDYAGRPRMTTDFSETAEAQWMKENCAEFGFILRYPDGATDITGIIFEPWHFRYVGREVAGYVMRRGFTFEEFWEEWQEELAKFESNGGDVEAWVSYEMERKLSGPETYVLEIYGEDGDTEVSLVF